MLMKKGLFAALTQLHKYFSGVFFSHPNSFLLSEPGCLTRVASWCCSSRWCACCLSYRGLFGRAPLGCLASLSSLYWLVDELVKER